MKHFIRLSFIAFSVMLFSSCAFHGGSITDSAALGQANFSYIEHSISGTASTTKILGIGGLDRKTIVEDAKVDMLRKHPLKPNQTLVNITVNWKLTNYAIVIINTCTITADVVEFK